MKKASGKLAKRETSLQEPSSRRIPRESPANAYSIKATKSKRQAGPDGICFMVRCAVKQASQGLGRATLPERLARDWPVRRISHTRDFRCSFMIMAHSFVKLLAKSLLRNAYGQIGRGKT